MSLIDAPANIKLPDRIPPLQLFEFNSTKFTAYPAVQSLEKPVVASIPVIVNPANQQLIKLPNLFPEFTRPVTTGQLSNLVLKTADTLR